MFLEGQGAITSTKILPNEFNKPWCKTTSTKIKPRTELGDYYFIIYILKFILNHWH